MATATEKKTFNYELFRKRVRLFDSSFVGERDLAISQALAQCAKHEPPMLFWEAAAVAFGGATAEIDRLADQIAQMQREAAAREREAASLAASLAEIRQANERLEQENRAWEDEVCRLAGGEAAPPALRFLRPKPWLVAAGLALAAEWLSACLAARARSAEEIYFMLQWLHVLAMALFLAWGVALYKSAGIGPLLVKSAVWIAGWAVAIGLLAWTHGGFEKNALAVDQMLLPTCWWGTRGVRASGLDAGIALFLLQWTLDLNLGLPFGRALCSLAQWIRAQEKRAQRR